MTRTNPTKSQAGSPGHPTEECTIQRGAQWKVSPSIISFNLFFGVAAGLNSSGAAFCMPVNQGGIHYRVSAYAILHFSRAPKMKTQFLPAFFP